MLPRALSLFGILLLAACAEQGPPPLNLERTHYSELTGWQSDPLDAALTAFMQSCSAWQKSAPDKLLGCSDLKLKAQHWQSLCAKAADIDPSNTEAVRRFFEEGFTPHRVGVNGANEGLFTGYYIPEIKGSLTQGGPYQTPVYGLPDDIVSGKEYYSRAEIYAGKLAGKGLEIAWAADPVDLFFVEIQGSGVIRLPDGSILTIGFAGKNNHPYVAIGRTMEEQGLLEAGNVNLFTIKDWLYKHPSRAKQVMSDNPSYVFFRKLPDNQVRGAQNVGLTAERSLAVDWHYIPYGLPIWLQTTLPETGFGSARPFNQLMIAQDTGGAIRGGIRGDIYFGHGKRAEALAGKQAMRGSYALLIPNVLAETMDTDTVHACPKK